MERRKFKKEEEMAFRFSRMEDLYDAAAGKPDHPHRHDYYTIIWCMQGSGKHQIDFYTYDLGANQLYFISPGQVHLVVAESRPEGLVMTFDQDFLIRNRITPDFISDLHIFRSYGESPPLQLEKDRFLLVRSWWKQMEAYAGRKNLAYRNQAIGALLKLILIECHSACSLGSSDYSAANAAALTILRNFKKLVEQHYREEKKVNFYASRLMISSDHLNRTVKTLTGCTAKAIIQDRIIMEAKRMLLHAGDQAKGVSYALGFDEPAHFSNFFKKSTGMTISRFKKSLK